MVVSALALVAKATAVATVDRIAIDSLCTGILSLRGQPRPRWRRQLPAVSQHQALGTSLWT